MLEHWIWLSGALVPSGKACDELIRRFSAEEIYKLSPKEYRELGFIQKGEYERLCDKSLTEAGKIAKYCTENGIGIMTYEDDCYPHSLKGIFSPPPVLYYRGKLFDFDDTPMLTVVGTRRSTKEGEKTAYEFSCKLSSAGCVIVSGMACGIDTNANKGCLAGGSPTIAVLGCGVDFVYPAGNAKLMEDIAARGLIISEFSPGTPGLPHNFPVRNRIMAGLGMGTLVIEAPIKSGALITARMALESGKELFVVPGSIYNSRYEGSNNLIKEGCCFAVTEPSDIVAHLPVHFEKEEKAEDVFAGIESPVEREIAELVFYHGKLRTDDIIELTGYSEAQVALSIMEMEIKGILEALGADWYSVHK